MHFLGFNYRITDIQCALGLSQLNKLGNFIKRRRKIARLYREAFNGMDEIECLNEKEYVESSWHIFPIRVKKNRDEIFNRLRSKGIGVNVHYIPIYYHPYYKRLGYKKGLCPKAEKYYKETVTLPLYIKMSNSEIERVAKLTKRVVSNL